MPEEIKGSDESGDNIVALKWDVTDVFLQSSTLPNVNGTSAPSSHT